MISSLLSFIFKTIWFVFHAIKLIYQLVSATSLGFILIFAIIIFVLSRYFRLKQPNLPKNIIDAIGGNQQLINDRQCSTGQQNIHCESSDINEWWPIANRAACLDSVENSCSAIEKVSQQK